MKVTSLEQNLYGKPANILVMAGGTGGHIFPGIAVADLLKAHGWKVHWLGTAERMEATLIPAHGFDISFIEIKGVRNKTLGSWLLMPFKLIKSVVQAIKVINQVKPDVVLGMGGYASAPGGFAAWLMRKPLVLHEQNAVAGMTNKFLAKFASKVLCAFPGAFPVKVKSQVTGNPLRKSIVLSNGLPGNEPKENTHNRNILVVGGSLGAQVLNDIVPEALSLLPEGTFNIWHQCGKGNENKVKAKYSPQVQLDNKNQINDFIDDMAKAYAWADVVICRAGALTVSEVAMAGKPAILVPLPHAVDDHQTRNAKYLVDEGAAKLLPQSAFNQKSLANMLTELWAEKETLPRMASAAKKAAHLDATELVAKCCAGVVIQ